MPSLVGSGNEITDALRALGIQGDGRLADSSFGIYEASRNDCPNGGLETSLNAGAGWAAFSGVGTLTRDSAHAKFGTWAMKFVGAGGASSEGPTNTTAFPATAGSIYTTSTWVFSVAGGEQVNLSTGFYTAATALVNTANSGTVTLVAGWNRLTCTAVAGASVTQAFSRVESMSTLSQTFWVDGFQFENKAYATPYIHTDGAVASRAQAGLTAPAALLNPMVGGFAARIRAGQPSSVTAFNTPRLIEWVIDGSNYLIVDYASNWRVLRQVAGSGPILSVAQTFNPGDLITVCAAWDAGNLYFSINGSAYTSIANTTVPAGTPPGGLSIGGLGFFAGQLNGEILWSGIFNGVLPDPAHVHALAQSSDPIPDAVNAAATWSADTLTYLLSMNPNIAATPPVLALAIDFTAAALVGSPPTPVKTDVSAKVRGNISVRRGRSSTVLDQIAAGTGTFDLNNDDRRFEPEYQGEIVNLITNPSAPFAGWSGWNGTPTAFVLSNDLPPPVPGGIHIGKVTIPSSGATGVFYDTGTILAAGRAFTFSVYVWCSGPDPLRIQLRELDSGGSLIGTTIVGAGAPSSSWIRVPVSRTFGGTGARAQLVVEQSGAGAVQTFYLAAAQLEVGPMTDYIDGYQDNGRWAGAADASASYRGGPYWPNVTPMRRLYFTATYGSTTYPLHTGYVEVWPIDWTSMKRTTSSITSTDGFDRLNQTELSGVNDPLGLGLLVLNGAVSGAFIDGVLTLAAWDSSSGARSDGSGGTIAAAGEEALVGVSLSYQDVQSALTLIQGAADSEAGIFFMDASNNAVFHDRDHRVNASRSQTLQAIFADSPADGMPYVTLSPDFDVQRVYNDVQVTPGFTGAIPQVADDATSKANYGTRTLSRTTQLLANQQAQDQASRILNDNKDPKLRFPTITLDPFRDPDLWPIVLGLEISDRIRVIRRPYTDPATAITKDCWVEAIQHDITMSGTGPLAWITTLSLSLADPGVYWKLDDTSRSLLGVSTFLR